MPTLKDRLDALNVMVGKKVNKLYDISEKTANKTTTLTGHTSADAAVKFPTVSAVNTGLGNKVDKVSGKGLSSNDFTTILKTKLEQLEGSKFRGTFIGEANLPTTLANGQPLPAGAYADVDPGTAGSVTSRWIWDVNDARWTEQIGSSTQLTASEIAALYHQVANEFTDAKSTQIETNKTDVASMLTELTTYYKALGVEFPDYATILNGDTPNIIVV